MDQNMQSMINRTNTPQKKINIQVDCDCMTKTMPTIQKQEH